MSDGPQNATAEAVHPPRLIPSLTGGFNAVAGNIQLILLPVLLDLLLWFGPRLRLKTLLEPAARDMLALMRRTSSAEMAASLDLLERTWMRALEEFNLTSMLNTFPIGVPSLMAGTRPVLNPLGRPLVVETESVGQMALLWLAFSLFGLLLATIYYAWTARFAARPEVECGDLARERKWPAPPFTPRVLSYQAMQVVILVIILFTIVLILMIPSFIMASFLLVISPVLAQFALLFIGLAVLWFLLPLVFAPHGIFVCGQSAVNALFTSMRVVRFSLPATGMFLLAVIVLSQGLSVLWVAAPSASWMALVGILGHAFISTALLAASFVYYRSGLAYVQAIRKKSMQVPVNS